MAQTRFKLMDVGFWSDESHWEATVTSTTNDTEVIGTVRQNISSFNSKWCFVGKFHHWRFFKVISVWLRFQIISMSKKSVLFLPTRLGHSSSKIRSHFLQETEKKREKNTSPKNPFNVQIHWGLSTTPLFRWLGFSFILASLPQRFVVNKRPAPWLCETILQRWAGLNNFFGKHSSLNFFWGFYMLGVLLKKTSWF